MCNNYIVLIPFYVPPLHPTPSLMLSMPMVACTPLHVACNNGQDVVVNILLQYKVGLNALNNRGQTPLHYAAYFPHGALCMELLVKSGADPNIQDTEGRTPLHMTAMFGFYLRTETLISPGEHGACRVYCYM